MKKLFTILAVAATLVSCAKEDVVRENMGEAIGFDNAFVENSTRSIYDPSYTNTNLFDGFRVYGFVENAPLFKGTEVTGSGLGDTGAWEYEGTQYWVAGANYKFHAVAPITANVDAANATYTAADGVSFAYTNVAGTEDLLYAYQTAVGKTSGNNDKVAFTFDHILSKVKFSFVNGYDASNATLKVTNVKITNAHKTANVALNNTTVTWTDNAGETDNDLDFGAATDRDDTTTAADYACGTTYESDNERFVIPSAEFEYNVTFTVELWINGVQVDVDSETTGVQGYNHTATAKFAPKAGNAYDISTTITASNIDPSGEQDAIEFTVTEINEWDTDYNDDAAGDNNVTM